MRIMKSKIFTLVILALLCASCHDSDDEVTEIYAGEWMSATPVSTIQEQWFVLPEEVTNFFKPDTVVVDNEIAIRKEYYLVFKAGTYNNGWNTFVVKPDGIFVVSNNDRLLQLNNFRYKMNYLTERDTISTKSITVRKSFSAKSSANKDGVLLFSRNDTTFRATKEDEGYYLEMIKPSDNDFYNHTMDKK